MDARNDYSLSSFIACHAFPTRVASALPGVTTACLPAWKRPEYRAEMRIAWKLPLKKKKEGKEEEENTEEQAEERKMMEGNERDVTSARKVERTRR